MNSDIAKRAFEELSLAKRQNGAGPFGIEYLQAGGESMPLDDSFADIVVLAYAL